eukprot:GHVH01014944.1.p1 GENE.GHVH01014944.1~~GHVH01014944.1.p1  ORF type:complete len:133 (+),score=11.65 GHVH01014944.1:164-562(+)
MMASTKRPLTPQASENLTDNVLRPQALKNCDENAEHLLEELTHTSNKDSITMDPPIFLERNPLASPFTTSLYVPSFLRIKTPSSRRRRHDLFMSLSQRTLEKVGTGVDVETSKGNSEVGQAVRRCQLAGVNH